MKTRTILGAIAPLAALALVGALYIAASAEPGRADAGVDGYTLSATATSTDGGGAIAVTVDVAPEYKWNKDYPAKFEVLGDLPSGVAVPKRLLKAGDVGIQSDDRRAVANLAWTGEAPGGAAVTVQARFSICNDRVCLMKAAKLSVPLDRR